MYNWSKTMKLDKFDKPDWKWQKIDILIGYTKTALEQQKWHGFSAINVDPKGCFGHVQKCNF